METYPTWHFEKDNDKSISHVLKGTKTSSIFIYNNHNSLPNQLLQVGSIGILIFDNEKKACKTRTTKVIFTEFRNITLEFAHQEEEAIQSLESYQESYFNFFRTIDPNFQLTSKIISYSFEVIEDLTKARLKTAYIIAESNKKILLNTMPITEINAGFNNDIFNVCDQYIIKVCSNPDLESEFLKESSFYIKHSNSTHFPKLYRYDDSKSLIPFVYEIMQKINGKSLYYYWYKMNEEQKEETIKKIVEIVKEIHQKADFNGNWCEYFKNDVKKCYEKTKECFNEEERKIFEAAFALFDRFLIDNNFVWIHNDLHFDNILVDGEKLYFIDFNDAMIAPIDYDFRIFFICMDMPWRWANSEMDPLQKKEDYQTIITYVLKYYKEMAEVNYLEQRMIIYSIQNEINLLARFNNLSLKETILSYSKRLLNLV
ncbi:hypothetical protein M9Y10_017496 [Tritrichomonas musculus]|uniref:Protein kinase domain-containing protein n=1 Tax=Tritrichomonas musculus TaxID=1915356 RepID=A0ABR2HTU7_9EUKA